MSIKRLEVKNFKSFKELNIELGRFNVIIGANASGKSNFVHILKFLRDITTSGLDNAISMQGGVEYLRNMNIGASQDLVLKVVSDREFRLSRPLRKTGILGIKIYETIYEFGLRFNKRGSGFKVVNDSLTLKCEFERKERKVKETFGKGIIQILHRNGNVKINLDVPHEVLLKKEEVFWPFLQEEKSLKNLLKLLREGKSQKNVLILEIPFIVFIQPIVRIFSDISIYDFDPKLPKKATPITGKAELEEDGSNLSIILKNITENKEKRRQLFNLVKDLLPFVEDLDVEKFADKSLLFKLKELYFKNQYLPASLISDGTINITALIIALYFEKKSFIIVEEPERNIHPSLISKVVGMMKDASQKKQIVVTTHNPEFVKYAGLENILLVSRDENGFSSIFRPADREEIKTFLKNDIGIEELYIQNLLEV